MNILTWHVHGAYLYYLTRNPRHRYYLPVKEGVPPGYGGRLGSGRWGEHVVDVRAEEVKNLDLDLVMYQSAKNWAEDQLEDLSPAQRRLPRIFLEHDPPQGHPTNTPHPVDDPSVLLAHVTPFNVLMWDARRTPTCVVEHGVSVPEDARYTGEKARGLVVVNGLGSRGRRLGLDVFQEVRKHVPLDLVGYGSEEVGGLGEVPHDELPYVAARYRFLFNPIRYTSLGLAVCEAMRVGLPVVGLATTEMTTVIENGVSGYVNTDVDKLVEVMQRLLADPEEAARLGAGAREMAEKRFGMERFARDWEMAYTKGHSARYECHSRCYSRCAHRQASR